jgi:hypothetical protein
MIGRVDIEEVHKSRKIQIGFLFLNLKKKELRNRHVDGKALKWILESRIVVYGMHKRA